MSDDLVKRLLHLDMHPESAPRQAADRIEALEVQLAAADDLETALRRFAACVFDDNGDVTISQGRLTRGDWLRLDATLAAYRKARGGEA